MTESLQRALDVVLQLPESEQNAIAAWLLSELESERKWTDLFSASQDQLASLANEALDEHSRGETRELDAN